MPAGDVLRQKPETRPPRPGHCPPRPPLPPPRPHPYPPRPPLRPRPPAARHAARLTAASPGTPSTAPATALPQLELRQGADNERGPARMGGMRPGRRGAAWGAAAVAVLAALAEGELAALSAAPARARGLLAGGWQGPVAGPGAAPLWAFGVAADVQSAPGEGERQVSLGVRRFYDGALGVASAAGRDWASSGVRTSVALGDLVDRRVTEPAGAFKAVINALRGGQPRESLSAPLDLHCLGGNHELENFARGDLRRIFSQTVGAPGWWEGALQRLVGSPPLVSWGPGDVLYREVRPAPGWRFLILDSYEISYLGRDSSEAQAREAAAWLDRERGGVRPPEGRPFSPAGLRGLRQRFTPLSGGFGEAQLRWASGRLADADRSGDSVVIFSHLPVLHGAQSFFCGGFCLAWDYSEASALFDAHRSVQAVFAGHDHTGGYAVSPGGVHHVTLYGMVEARSAAHGTVECHEEGLFLKGRGDLPSRWLRSRTSSGKGT